MKFVGKNLVFSLLAATSAAPLSTAMAQEAKVQPAAGAAVEEIVVTARKREERLSDVPIAISTFSGKQLQDSGVANLTDLSTVAAGVSFRQDVAGRASPSIVIRGIGFDDFRSNGNPAVAVSFDDVYQGSNALIGGGLFDIDRIEILKGPQGTLYGRNTTAGAVNVITREPGDAASANSYLEYGSYDHIRAEAGVGGALGDAVRLRVAAVYESGGGFLTNKGTTTFAGLTSAPGVIPPLPFVPETQNVGDADFLATRVTLVIEPSTETKITAQFNYARDQGDNSQSDVLGRSATGFTEPDTDPFTYYGNLAAIIDSDQAGFNLRLEQDLGAARLTAIGSYITLNRAYTFDPGDPRRRFDLDYADDLDQYTGEIRLAGSTGTGVDWTIGGFLFQDEIRLRSVLDASDFVRSIVATDYLQTRDSWALFGEADWQLSSQITLTAGIRYTDDASDFSGLTKDLNPYGVSVAAAALRLPVAFDNTFHDDNLSGRLILSYRPMEDALVYASYSQGYKSGGFDGSTIFSAPEALPFQSENVDAYEIGAKFLDAASPFNVTIAGFFYSFDDLQANSVRQTAGVATAVRTNVAKATVWGGEIEAVLRPVRNARIGLAVTHLDTTVDDFVSSDPAEVARRNGNDLPDAPQFAFNADARYTFALSGGWQLEPQMNASFIGDHFKEIDNFVEVKGYGRLDLRLALKSPDTRWSLAAFGRNVTDSFYFTGVIPATSAGVVVGQQRIVGRPATYGISLGYAF
ncbi:TonB-dependent receptor [Phenylobacterium parvum]|uniref:TonB-dependent receptor n=1 Tax=Phenylobacterium parvum TaxID=2201350 RepID=A0A2Z3HLY7_9CAUL|nr:TonB-dependent receptor [Phenylobacterium parvum]AWM77503.1 TonB-dependent receptor [Phenylobacterium parvum]